MKKILLIQPSPYDREGRPVKKKKLYFVGLAMPLLAALTPKDYQVEICLETIEEVPFDTDAKMVGISTMGHGVHRSIDLAKEFKRRGKTVILGGYMASLMKEEALKYCDALVVGDGEEVWEELLLDYEKGTLKRLYEKPLEPVKGLKTPLPRFDLITNKNIGDFLPLQAGRGCPHTCSFCSVACLYQGRYIKKALEDVKNELQQIKDLGFKKVTLLDDNIHSDRAYLDELLKILKNFGFQWMSQCDIKIGDDRELLRKLKESGCNTLSFGLESLEEESLQSMNKSWADPKEYDRLIQNIVDAGIDVSTEMVFGGEGDSPAVFDKTVAFIEKNKIPVPRFYILTPIPGTPFFQKMKKEGRLISEDVYTYDGTKAEHRPKNMTPEELTEGYWETYRRLFEISSILKRTIFRRDFFKRPLRFLFYFGVNLYYRHNIKRGVTPNIF